MLLGKTLLVKELTQLQIQTMFEIMQKYYANIQWDNFANDLNQKCEVIVLCDENGTIHGFTTLAVFTYDDNTQLLFSGDTIIEKEYWGSNDLSHIWIKCALSHAKKFEGKTYWLLFTKGYKTYKFLHVFFNEFYPRVGAQTPSELQKIIDKYATNDGVYVAGRDFLKEVFAEIDETKLKDKNTAFFLEKNPGYKNGDELVCLCELSVENLNKLGRRTHGQ
jgi:hypothetical protein